MKTDIKFPRKVIFAFCKEDIRGIFESYFTRGRCYKGFLCQADNSESYYIYVVTDDNGYDFIFFANSEKASRGKFLKLFNIVSKEEFEKYRTFKRFSL